MRTCVGKIAVVLLLTLVVGCREVPRYFGGSRVLAEAAGKKLHARDVQTVVPKDMTGEDSVAFMERYIERWIHRQLKLREAERLFSKDERDIDSLIEEYRQALLIRKFDEYLVERADTLITQAQIETYYKDHASDFKASQTLVRGRIIRFPSGSRQAQRVRALMAQRSDAARQDLAEVCAKNNFEMEDFTASWVTWSEFLSYLPIPHSRSQDALLRSGVVQQLQDSHSGYYFEVTAVRRQGDTEPLERVEATVRRILHNQRQNEIIRENEQHLYDRALEEGKVNVYNED